MAFPAPPIRGEEVIPAALGGVNGRIKAQETPVLPEPRTYYAGDATGRSVTTTPIVGLSIPIFWRPGNQISILFTYSETTSAAVTSGKVSVAGLPTTGGTEVDLIAPHALPVFPDVRNRTTSPTTPAGVELNGFSPFTGAGFLVSIPNSNAGAPGVPNTVPGLATLEFKSTRTAGSSNVYTLYWQAWVQVF